MVAEVKGCVEVEFCENATNFNREVPMLTGGVVSN